MNLYNESTTAAAIWMRESKKAECERNDLLARIHRDGGHHTGEVGVEQSVDDAHEVWAEMVRERDDARRWGNAAMVRFEAMLLTKEEFIAEAARVHRGLERERDEARGVEEMVLYACDVMEFRAQDAEGTIEEIKALVKWLRDEADGYLKGTPMQRRIADEIEAVLKKVKR